MENVNQVVWAPVARSSFQGRTREIPGSIFKGNNVWPVSMPLRMSRISRLPLVGRKPMRKPKKIGKCMSWENFVLSCAIKQIESISSFFKNKNQLVMRYIIVFVLR